MFRTPLLIASLTALLTVAGAAHAQSPQLAGSEWRPIEIAGDAVDDDAGIFIRFGAEGAVEGNGGCNRFTGSYELDGGKIAIGPLAATRMACPEPSMANETRFFQALGRIEQFSRERIDLKLRDGDGNPVILLVQTDAD